MQATTFRGLGHPSRLEIVEFLRNGSRPVGDIVEELGIRQPQVSKHLRNLSESGIVVAEPRSRQRIYHLEEGAFSDLGHWVDSFEGLWGARLDGLGSYLGRSEGRSR